MEEKFECWIKDEAYKLVVTPVGVQELYKDCTLRNVQLTLAQVQKIKDAQDNGKEQMELFQAVFENGRFVDMRRLVYINEGLIWDR